MPVAATGTTAVLWGELERIVAASTVFQARVGAANAPEALAFIFIDAFTPEGDLDADRPYCLIETGPGGWRKDAEVHYGSSHAFSLVFEDNVPEAYQDGHRDAMTDFMNFVDGVIANIRALAGTDWGGATLYIAPSSIQRVEGHPVRPALEGKENAGEDYIYCRYDVEIGY